MGARKSAFDVGARRLGVADDFRVGLLGDIGVAGFWSMVLFLAVLTVGFIYEWKKGALEWE